MRVRDSQRQRLYNAEAAAQLAHTGKEWQQTIPNGALQDWVDQVMARRAVRARWGKRHIQVELTHGGARASASGIRLGRGARNEWVILHEIAHCLTPGGCADHGPEFAGILLYLVDTVLGRAAGAQLRISFSTHQVRYTRTAIPEPRCPVETKAAAAARRRQVQTRRPTRTEMREAAAIIRRAATAGLLGDADRKPRVHALATLALPAGQGSRMAARTVTPPADVRQAAQTAITEHKNLLSWGQLASATALAGGGPLGEHLVRRIAATAREAKAAPDSPAALATGGDTGRAWISRVVATWDREDGNRQLAVTLDRKVIITGRVPAPIAAVPTDDGGLQVLRPVRRMFVTAQHLLGAAIATKRMPDLHPGDNHYVEAQHPRDRKGKWIDKGARVKLGLSGFGIVQGWDGTKLTVQRERDKKTVTVDASRVEAINPPKRPGQNAPNAPTPPHVPNAPDQPAAGTYPPGYDPAKHGPYDPKKNGGYDPAKHGPYDPLKAAKNKAKGGYTYKKPQKPIDFANDLAALMPEGLDPKTATIVAALRWRRGYTPDDVKDWPPRVTYLAKSGELSKSSVVCDLGHEHYSANGGAGVLVRHQDQDGTYRYLLQKRAHGVQLAGTWSTPGGGIDDGETPQQAAAREALEELGVDPSNLREVFTHTQDDGGWAYHTVVLDSPEMFEPNPENATHGGESAGVQWVTAEEMNDLPLHPGFEAARQAVIDQSEGMPAGDPLPAPPQSLPFGVGAPDDGRNNLWDGFATGPLLTSMPVQDQRDMRALFDRRINEGRTPEEALQDVRAEIETRHDIADAQHFDDYWGGFATTLDIAGLPPQEQQRLHDETQQRANEIGVVAALAEARARLDETHDNGGDLPDLLPDPDPGPPDPNAPPVDVHQVTGHDAPTALPYGGAPTALPHGGAPDTGLPPGVVPQPGDLVYVHPQGAAILVHPDGSMEAFGKNGKHKSTSATPEKLAAGHGAWTEVPNDGSLGNAQLGDAGGTGGQEGGGVSAPDQPGKPTTWQEDLASPDLTPATAVPSTESAAEKVLVLTKVQEPENKSQAAPGKVKVPMNFESADVAQVPQFIADPNYHFQQKVDGIRGQLVIEPGKKPWFRSKAGGKLVSPTATAIMNPMLAKMGPQPEGGPSYAVDGELLNGKWHVFDMVVDGHESQPWEDRMALAEEWVKQMHGAGLTNINALPVARTAAEKQALWDAVNASGGEGVMMKRRDAKYKFGSRSNEIVKGKITSTADVVVMEKGTDGKANAVMGVYKDGKLTPVGSVSLLGKEKTGPINVGDVIEVEYLNAHPGTLNLTQPRVKKKRPDKNPLEATDAQLRFIDKSVLDASAVNGKPDAAIAEAPGSTPVNPDATPNAPGNAPNPALHAQVAAQLEDWYATVGGYDPKFDAGMADLEAWMQDSENGPDPIASLQKMREAIDARMADSGEPDELELLGGVQTDIENLRQAIENADNRSTPNAPGANTSALSHSRQTLNLTVTNASEEASLHVASPGVWDQIDALFSQAQKAVQDPNVNDQDAGNAVRDLIDAIDAHAAWATPSDAAGLKDVTTGLQDALDGLPGYTAPNEPGAQNEPGDWTPPTFNLGSAQVDFDAMVGMLNDNPSLDPTTELRVAVDLVRYGILNVDLHSLPAALENLDGLLTVRRLHTDTQDPNFGTLTNMQKVVVWHTATLEPGTPISAKWKGEFAAGKPTLDAPAVPEVHPVQALLDSGPHDPSLTVDIEAADALQEAIAQGQNVFPDDNVIAYAFLNQNGESLKASHTTSDGFKIKPGDTVSLGGVSRKVIAIRDVHEYVAPGQGQTTTMALYQTSEGHYIISPANAAEPPTPNLPAVPDDVKEGDPGTMLDVATAEAPPGVSAADSPWVTEAMQLAVKQKWKLPTGSMGELQDQLSKVKLEEPPSALELMTTKGLNAADAAKEHKRLLRNAKVNEWRARNKLQAAIDTLKAKDAGHDAAGVQTIAPPPKKAAKAPKAGSAAAAAKAKAATSSTPILDAGDTPAGLGKQVDALMEKGAPPKVLTTYDEHERDAFHADHGSDVQPAGHVDAQTAWFDAMKDVKPGAAPIPISDLNHNGYVVAHGLAYKDTSGRAYLVERRDGESTEDALARGAAAQKIVDAVLSKVPETHRGFLRGVALVEGSSPDDAHWAEKYNTPGFKTEASGGDGGMTFFGGDTPKPTTVAHEFGHNVDASLHALIGVDHSGSAGSPWNDAIAADQRSSSAWAGKYVETRVTPFTKPVQLGKIGVTDYGANSNGEDWAESVRLWLKDRREGKIGYDKTTSTNLRFSDVFPERAKVLDAFFGVEHDPNTPARSAARAAAQQHVYEQLKNPNASPVSPTSNALMETFGLPKEDAVKAMADGAEQWKKNQAAIETAKKEAAEAAAKEAAKWASIKGALAGGVIDQATAGKLAARVRAAKFHAKKKGASEAEANEVAKAYEAKLLQELAAGNIQTTAGSPKPGAHSADLVKGVTVNPEFKMADRTQGHQWLHQAGMTVHPLALKQMGEAQQAKANLSAEIASRLNNKQDWEIFRKYRATDLEWDYAENTKQLKAFEEYSADERQALLAQAVSARIGMWASSSGDTNQPAVLMQAAVKEEFGVDGHPAPRMSKATFDAYMKNYEKVKDWYRRFARAQYEHTQEEFKKAGITHVSLYRGMRWNSSTVPDWANPPPPTVRAALQPINSWSTAKSTAKSFAGGGGAGSRLLQASVPVAAIIGSARTGFGCLNESEFVVLDLPGEVTVLKAGQTGF